MSAELDKCTNILIITRTPQRTLPILVGMAYLVTLSSFYQMTLCGALLTANGVNCNQRTQAFKIVTVVIYIA